MARRYAIAFLVASGVTFGLFYLMQALISIIDHGMSVQEAVEAPRLWTQGGTKWHQNGKTKN